MRVTARWPRMTEADVLIVGGGPAGSTLARLLKRAGKDVAIMDKAEFPRDKVCAGWVTPAVFEELEIDLEDYARGRVLQPIHGFRTGRIGQRQVQSDFPGEPASFGIRRFEFDHYLLQRCGAELLLGQPFKNMRREPDGWLVNDTVKARLVVGAGGHFCPVARFAGAKGPSETAVAAQEIEFEMNPRQRAECPVDGDVPELYFTPDLKGYGWVFRKGDFLNIGLGREDKHRLSAHVEAFRDYLTGIGRIPRDLPGKFKGHAYLLYPHACRPPVADGIMLIGDAAGLAYVQSGEGIRPAVESALLAAGVILDCGGDYSAERLAPYAEALAARFGKRDSQPAAHGKMATQARQLLAGWLLKSRWFSRNFVVRRWFLHQQDKPLAASAAHVAGNEFC
jgi:geranylgeranyl reductase family protein